MPTLEQKKHRYKCLLCRKEFNSHVPKENAVYMWNVLQYRPKGGNTVLRCPHCFSMYYIHEDMYKRERYVDTYKLFKYIDKHILDKEKGYDKELYDKMKMWFEGVKLCSTCGKLKSRSEGFTYLQESSDKLSHVCRECLNSVKNVSKVEKILKKYEEAHEEK